MKKEYIAPQTEVYRLQTQGQLLTYSGYSGGPLGAREFELDDDEPSARKANGIWDGEEDLDE